jgi:cytochrome oxidase Cu insertion factor (SCO1/SenC/PrrC family)
MTTVDPGNQAADQRRGRRMLLLLAALFLLPLAVSFWLYYGSAWRPAGTVERGQLVSPALPLPEVVLPLAPGAASTSTSPAFLEGKWSVVFIGDGACDTRCRQALVDSRQVRLALDKDMDRVQRVFLFRGDCCEAGWLEGEQAGLLAVRADGAEAASQLAPFDAVAGGQAMLSGRLYLVDPLGNLMMSYAPDAPPKDLLKDLERLLKLSHIG